jgi:hypothetical protein
MVYCYDKLIVQDYESGAISYLSSSHYEDTFAQPDTWPLVSSFTFANGKYNNGKPTFHSLLEVMAETGVGLTTGQGSDPRIMLEMSDDGGRTWRAAPDKSLGAIGKYRSKVRWWKLGMTRDRIYRCTVSDPVKFIVSDAALETVG